MKRAIAVLSLLGLVGRACDRVVELSSPLDATIRFDPDGGFLDPVLDARYLDAAVRRRDAHRHTRGRR
jgi:hypothetical protein